MISVHETTPSRSIAAGSSKLLRAWMLWLGAASLAIPTIVRLAQEYWPLEEGTHGPILLATGIWLLVRARKDVAAVAQPGDPRLAHLLFWPSLLGFIFSQMTGMLGPQCMSVYGALIAVFYYHAGWRALRLLWFPLVYMLFMFPQPETLILPLTHVLKLGLSTSAVWLLSSLGYAVGHGGVVLYVDQYELLVASACSGMNSLIGLGAIGVFFAYIRHDGQWRPAVPLLLTIVPIALVANFIRVMILILVTHYFGIRAALVYVHDGAGIIMFAIAVLMLIGADTIISWRQDRKAQA